MRDTEMRILSGKTENKKARAGEIALSALFAALICVCSQIYIPMPFGITLTLQTFAVSLCGYTLGVRGGVCSVLCYIFCGLVGLPVFSGLGSGISALSGPTGGFIFGFAFLAVLCGKAGRLKNTAGRVILSLVGIFLCHLCGVLRFAAVSGAGLAEAFLTASLPFLLKDVVLLFPAFGMSGKITGHLKAQDGRRL